MVKKLANFIQITKLYFLAKGINCKNKYIKGKIDVLKKFLQLIEKKLEKLKKLSKLKLDVRYVYKVL